MSQLSFSEAEYATKKRVTRREQFLTHWKTLFLGRHWKTSSRHTTQEKEMVGLLIRLARCCAFTACSYFIIYQTR